MSLPFKTLTPPETVEIAGFLLPKYGSLTVAEERAIRDLDAGKEEDTSLTDLQADLILKEKVVTILIQSRIVPDWTLENTRAETWYVVVDDKTVAIAPTMHMLDSLFEFFINEQRRWRSPVEAQPKTAEKKNLTGRKSTGVSASTTPEKNGSLKPDLEAVPS